MTLTAILVALFVWWFSTGAIFWAVSRGAGRAEVILTSPLAAAAFYAIHWASQQPGPTAAFVGFGAAIAIWGWFELAFLTGVITGPNTKPCPPGLKGKRRFLMAWGTLSYHEISLLAAITLISVLCKGAPDQTGFWTFMVLFVARISAKLNVFLGVPNLSHDMMPSGIAYMKTYFATRRMNWLFPVSITLLTAAVVFWINRALATDGPATGFILIASLTALALLEHWLMVLPVRDSALWQWMTQRRNTDTTGTESVD